MKAIFAAFVLCLTLHPAPAEPVPVPSGVQAEAIATYDLERLSTILSTELQEFSSFPVQFLKPRYPVRLYRITYRSVIPEQQNRPTIASGLIAIPETKETTLPVVSYQHGTVFTKTAVPSRPEESAETRLMIANFAGQGYVVIAADYFGKGSSTETDSYLVKASTQQACFDFLQAAQAVSKEFKIEWGPLFLSGWSQGGWATLAFLEKLQRAGIPVARAGAASAPGDVYATMNGWIHARREIDAVYLPAVTCIQIYAAAAYYNLPGLPDAAIRSEYVETARALYLNTITWDEAYSKLPATVKELFREEFLNTNAPESARYWELLSHSQSYRWRSSTPLRMYYGQQDEVVTPYIGTLPVDFQKAVGGAETTGVNAGETANHRGTFLHAMADQQKWFADFDPTAKAPIQPATDTPTANPAPAPSPAPAGTAPSAP